MYVKIFRKCKSQSKFYAPERSTRSKFHTDDPLTLGAPPQYILRRRPSSGGLCTTAFRLLFLFFYQNYISGLGSSVGIATDYGLDGPGIEKKIPVRAKFFAHVQTGPGAHSASCTMGTGSLPGVNRSRRDADHPPPPSAEVENE
jgi:hypothetical protein